MIVDCFLYFNEKELLELRVKYLYDTVDQFVIFEGNRTFSGTPKKCSAQDVLNSLGVPTEKIRFVEVDLPSNDVQVELDEFDHILRGRSLTSEKTHKNTWHRERIQKDAISDILQDYDDAIFLVSNCDEIVDKNYLKWAATIAAQNKQLVIRIPLVFLEGRADLRLYYKETGLPVEYERHTFLCTKEHLLNTKASNLQFDILCPYQTAYLTQDNNKIEDCGWHFSWMGDSERLKSKLQSYSHYADYNTFLNIPDCESNDMIDRLEQFKAADDGETPLGDKRYVLKKYPTGNLPQIIYDLPSVKNFLLPEE